ncbi:Protein of unknown function [Gryllus bimaculatus]|nr:Protein of unknown function [Gryllus bimaculatus]
MGPVAESAGIAGTAWTMRNTRAAALALLATNAENVSCRLKTGPDQRSSNKQMWSLVYFKFTQLSIRRRLRKFC